MTLGELGYQAEPLFRLHVQGYDSGVDIDLASNLSL
jgi:hypothetical protein